MFTTMLDPYGNEVLVDDPHVPPPGDEDAPPFDPDEDRLEELLALTYDSLQFRGRLGGMRHE